MTKPRSENDKSSTPPVPTRGAKPDGDSEGRYSVRSVGRALRLLNALAEVGPDGLSVTEAGQQIKSSKSATFALLKTLVEMDYATTFGHGPRYRLGPAVVHLADNYTGSLPWLEVARPVARELTAQTGWTSRVASHIDGRPIFQERIDGPGTIRFFTQLGIKELPHTSSAGKAMLSCMSEDAVRRIVAETGLPGRTPNTITDVEVLLRDLRQTVTRGYAIDDEEDDQGVFCLAAAFRAVDGEPVGAVSITGLKATIPSWRVHEFGARVLAAANQVTVAIGGQPISPVGTEVRSDD